MQILKIPYIRVLVVKKTKNKKKTDVHIGTNVFPRGTYVFSVS